MEFAFIALESKIFSICGITKGKVYKTKNNRFTYDNGDSGQSYHSFSEFISLNPIFKIKPVPYDCPKGMLKDGMIIVTSGGELIEVSDNVTTFSGHYKYGAECWDENLKCTVGFDTHNDDIVKIYDPTLLWEKNPVKIVTLADIKKVFGDNIKVEL